MCLRFKLRPMPGQDKQLCGHKTIFMGNTKKKKTIYSKRIEEKISHKFTIV
jgi:hypothetical protein